MKLGYPYSWITEVKTDNTHTYTPSTHSCGIMASTDWDGDQTGPRGSTAVRGQTDTAGKVVNAVMSLNVNANNTTSTFMDGYRSYELTDSNMCGPDSPHDDDTLNN